MLFPGDAPDGPEIRSDILIRCVRVWDLISWRRSPFSKNNVWYSNTLYKDTGPYFLATLPMAQKPWQGFRWPGDKDWYSHTLCADLGPYFLATLLMTKK